jgi:2-iminobutanoate/2-iminopropanoate deaminase
MTADRTVTHLEGTDFQKSRAFSPAVVTQGGKIVWLAGQTALTDLDGKSIAHDFDAQARTCFALIDRTLNRVGGKLADLVTMTVSINDPRHGDRFIKIRHEMFRDGKFPCSALITVSNFAHPGILIEIQGVAVCDWAGGSRISRRFQCGVTNAGRCPARSVTRLQRQAILFTGTTTASGHFREIVPTIAMRLDEESRFGRLADTKRPSLRICSRKRGRSDAKGIIVGVHDRQL